VLSVQAHGSLLDVRLGVGDSSVGGWSVVAAGAAADLLSVLLRRTLVVDELSVPVGWSD